jgi:hypothetical protein
MFPWCYDNARQNRLTSSIDTGDGIAKETNMTHASYAWGEAFVKVKHLGVYKYS